MKKLFALLTLSLVLAGCAYNPTRFTERERNTIAGMAIGAGTGTAIGCAAWWSGGCWWGLGIGTITGGLIGASLPTRNDYAYYPYYRHRHHYRHAKATNGQNGDAASSGQTPASVQPQK